MDVPEFWAVQFEHPCADFKFRQWRTDVGLHLLSPNSVSISIQTYHWLLSSYVGEEPLDPVPSSPAIVRMLLDRTELEAYSGAEAIGSQAALLPVGEGNRLITSLENGDRRCPILFLSCAPDTRKPRLDSATLARLLAGSVKVIAAKSPELDEELAHLLPHMFRCTGGMVRLYQPGVLFSSTADSRRHRFFTRDRIDEIGQESVKEMLVRSIARRARFASPHDLSSVEHVRQREREYRLSQLRNQQENTSEREWIEALEDDNAALNERATVQDGELRTLQSSHAELQDQLDDLTSDLERREGEIRHLRLQVEKERAATSAVEGRLTAISALATLPTSIPEMLEMIEKLHAGRLAFTERAYRSAQEATLDDPGVAWKCLWSLAEILWPLLFEEASNDLVGEYKRRSGFEFAPTESGVTKKDRGLRALRQDTFEGEEIDITPHIKIGVREPKCLRVHFHMHRDRRLIVVGHCGDHLETGGSRRRR